MIVLPAADLKETLHWAPGLFALQLLNQILPTWSAQSPSWAFALSCIPQKAAVSPTSRRSWHLTAVLTVEAPLARSARSTMSLQRCHTCYRPPTRPVTIRVSTASPRDFRISATVTAGAMAMPRALSCTSPCSDRKRCARLM